MRIGLYTIPATGTRFVSKYLRHIKADFSQRHVFTAATRPEWRRVLTVRHPHDCYLSQQIKFSHTDAEFVALWGQYIWRTQWMDAFYFPLDIPEINRRRVLQDLQSWCGKPFDMAQIDAF